MASIRDQIVDRIVEKLATVTLANGYSFDVGSDRVHRARAVVSQLPTPCIVVAQGPEHVTNKVGDRDQRRLVLDVIFATRDAGGDPDGQACTFMRDVQTALGGCRAATDDSLLTIDLIGGGTSTYQFILTEVQNEVNYGDVVPDLVYGAITFVAEYKSHLLDPSKH